MTASFREILEVLNRNEVEFIVVGGVAAVIHGAPTTTFDLDTLVRLSNANTERLVRALSQLEARFREHHATIRPSIDDILAGGHLQLLTRAGPLDVLGFTGEQQRYEDLLGASSEIDMSIGSLRVLDLEALIAEKKRMGRTKDNAAVELLEEVQRQHNRRSDS
jgi:hypothetical protein